MITRLKQQLQSRQQRWLAARIPPRDKATLHLRNIYIIPSRNGMLFLVACVLVFVAAINYAVSLAFGLTFMMVSIFVLSILHSFNNLRQLHLASHPAPAVYCGEEASFKVVISRNANRSHEALLLSFAGGIASHADLVSQDQEIIDVFIATSKRGLMRAPQLRITTYYPLGLCRAWAIVDLNMHCIVYPKPVPHVLNQFTSGSAGGDDSAVSMAGSEDFYGLRDYVPGDSLRQVAWKNVARGQGMQLKQFVDYVDSQLWLDWDMFYGFGVEERLSRICYCVLKLSRSGKPFGLKMPNVEFSPSTGQEHRNRMLKALALYGTAETT